MSCGPVHRFTRVKKIPREYSLNYCIGEVKAPRTDVNKNPWIVFSDREKNPTYNNAGGKVKLKETDYLDPFLVIKKKGDYLRLIKYTPDVVKNGKLDYKKAEYYGWMHKSNLLLTQQSVTDIASGKKNKMLVMIGDTVFLNTPADYFIQDSLKTYRDLHQKSQANRVAPYSIVYQLKKEESEKNKKILIAQKPYLEAETIQDDVLGWVDQSFISNIGTGLHVNVKSIPVDSIQFIEKQGENLLVTDDMVAFANSIKSKHQNLQYNPVSSYCEQDTLAAFKTRTILPLFDLSDNYIFNVKGGQISHERFRSIARNLKNINVSFVFEGRNQTISSFPQIINALQQLQPIFEQDNSYNYLFNCVLTFDDSDKAIRPESTDLTSNYAEVINYLSDMAGKNLKPIKMLQPWAGLRRAVEILEYQAEATNLIVLIGEQGHTNESIDSRLIDKLIKNNCRIVGFQLYAGEGDAYNNFVLDIEQLILSYANNMIHNKQDILVSPGQIKHANYFTEVGEVKNGYRLDFPENSITQGALFFPQKKEFLPMETLSNNVDTVIQQIKSDNENIIDCMTKAFHTTGNNRTKFDSIFIKNQGLDSTRTPARKLATAFIRENPGWYLPSKVVLLHDSINRSVDYHLMLSELEVNELKEFITSLSAVELEFLYQEEGKNITKKRCDCPEDDLFVQPNTEMTAVENDSLPREYADTRKARRYLYNRFMKTMKQCKVCKERGSKLKSMTLAEAQQRITGCPTSTEMLKKIRLKDIKKKKKVPDKMLDELINYYKNKVKNLDKAEQFESNGEPYYWIDRKLLP